MNNFDGLKLASVLTGIFIPLMLGIWLLSNFELPEPPAPTPIQVELQPSYVKTFRVEYDAYGNTTVGSSKINCTIANNDFNTDTCVIYLMYNGTKITENIELTPSKRMLVIDSLWVPEQKGSYDAELVYIVGESTITCPYKILVNEGEI